MKKIELTCKYVCALLIIYLNEWNNNKNRGLQDIIYYNFISSSSSSSYKINQFLI